MLHQEFAPGLISLRHPYVHQIFAITVSFLLTYRSQLAYQRFWEGRTMLQTMSSRWKDAALQLYIFDDQVDKTKNENPVEAAHKSAAYRGQVYCKSMCCYLQCSAVMTDSGHVLQARSYTS